MRSSWTPSFSPRTKESSCPLHCKEQGDSTLPLVLCCRHGELGTASCTQEHSSGAARGVKFSHERQKIDKGKKFKLMLYQRRRCIVSLALFVLSGESVGQSAPTGSAPTQKGPPRCLISEIKQEMMDGYSR